MNKEKRIPRTYGDRTYVHGWDIKRLSYPKDHDPYCPPGGKLTFATHDRFGTYKSLDLSININSLDFANSSHISKYSFMIPIIIS